MMGTIVDVLARYGTLISAAVFYGFFAASLAALTLRDREAVRRSYGVFLLCLVLGSGLTGLQPIPAVNINEYSSVAPERYVHYDLRVVDAEGRELPYDPRAVRPAIQNEELAENVGKVGTEERTLVAYTPSERRELAAFLLRNAREYREWVNAGVGPLERLRFPPHHLRGRWTTDELDGYDEFVGVRVYRIEVTFTDGGRSVVTGDGELVYEYRPEGNEAG